MKIQNYNDMEIHAYKGKLQLKKNGKLIGKYDTIDELIKDYGKQTLKQNKRDKKERADRALKTQSDELLESFES